MIVMLIAIYLGGLLIDYLERRKIMAALKEVTDALSTLNTDVDNKFAEVIKALGTPPVATGASTEELDVVLGTISTLNSKVNAFVVAPVTPPVG